MTAIAFIQLYSGTHAPTARTVAQLEKMVAPWHDAGVTEFMLNIDYRFSAETMKRLGPVISDMANGGSKVWPYLRRLGFMHYGDVLETFKQIGLWYDLGCSGMAIDASTGFVKVREMAASCARRGFNLIEEAGSRGGEIIKEGDEVIYNPVEWDASPISNISRAVKFHNATWKFGIEPRVWTDPKRRRIVWLHNNDRHIWEHHKMTRQELAQTFARLGRDVVVHTVKDAKAVMAAVTLDPDAAAAAEEERG